MVRKLIGAVVLVVFVTMTSAAFAADVYITKNGKKYHTQTCPLVQKKVTSKIDEEQAIKDGRVPCSKCSKDKIAKVKQVEKKK